MKDLPIVTALSPQGDRVCYQNRLGSLVKGDPSPTETFLWRWFTAKCYAHVGVGRLPCSGTTAWRWDNHAVVSYGG